MIMEKVDLSLFNNRWFIPGSILRICVWYFINALFFNTRFPYPISLKLFFLKLFGAKLKDKGIVIKPNVNIKYPWLLSIDNNVWIGENVWIDNLAQIKISSNVCISQGAMLLCGNHDYKKRNFELFVNEITIEDGVWIGAKSIVCPGVTCKSHSVLTVGAVATNDLEPYSIYQGNPAVKIKERTID